MSDFCVVSSPSFFKYSPTTFATDESGSAEFGEEEEDDDDLKVSPGFLLTGVIFIGFVVFS